MQLRFYLRMLQRGWWIIAITALSALVIALVNSYQTTPIYRTSARFIISPNTDQTSASRDVVNSLTALDKRTISSTFAEILDSVSVYREAGEALNIAPSQLRSYRISTVVLPESNILELSVTGSDPEIVTLLANNVGRKGIDSVMNLYQVYTIDVLDPAVPPTAPLSPNPQRDASLALVLGALLGSVIVVGREYLQAPFAALHQHTNTDSLSSTYTRSYTLHRLEEFVQQGSGELSLGLVQLDGLEDVMATLPKPVLQQLLQRVTVIFRDELRGNDIVGRWSDAKFIVLLPLTSGPIAMETINRICLALSKPIHLNASGETILLNLRAGLIEYHGDETANVLVERAEIALEQTRQNGSRATLFSSDMQTASA